VRAAAQARGEAPLRGAPRRLASFALAIRVRVAALAFVAAVGLFAGAFAARADGDPAPAPERIDRSLLLRYLADKSAFTLFDARSPEEFEAGHVDGAVRLPIEAVERGHPALPASLDAPILVYCRSGRRAAAVVAALAALGYRDARVLPSEQLVFHDGLIVFQCGT